MGIDIKVSLVKCGTCGKRYNNPFTHVCRVPLSKAAKKSGKKSSRKK